MRRLRSLVLIALAIYFLRGPSSAQVSPTNFNLTGVVRSTDGKVMEGVAVSARRHDSTFTISVYTDENGKYFFVPLASGEYRLWAQAVGFETGASEFSGMPDGKVRRDFRLKTLKDFSMQLSGTEWTASLPDDSSENRRMKEIFHRNCSDCHISSFVLQNRFDSPGWEKIVNFMEKTSTTGFILPGTPPNIFINAYKKDLIEYLTLVRGPEPYPLKFKPMPRPRGEAAQIVVTEYDLSPGNKPGYILTHNGSNWSEGTPSFYEANGVHDAVVDQNGLVWFTDDITPERTIGKLDPRTGKVTDYKLSDENNAAVRSHGIIVDQAGKIWFTNGSEGILVEFDPKTEQFRRFPRRGSPPQRIGGTITVDSRGNLWVTQPEGAFKLDPKTGEYTAYQSPTKGGVPYGITVDSQDNAWYAEFGGDRVVHVNAQTGHVREVVLDPLTRDITDEDRQIGARAKGIPAIGSAPYSKGPRRLGADRKGNAVWVAECWGGRLLKIDIDSLKQTEYELPYPHSSPYAAMVDKKHMVWINLMNSDRIAKFDPETERFTEYPLPTLGTGTRFIWVDDSTEVSTVWVPYNRNNKIARVQFRSPNGQHRPGMIR